MWFVDVIFRSSDEKLCFVVFLVLINLRSIFTTSHNYQASTEFFLKKKLFKETLKKSNKIYSKPSLYMKALKMTQLWEGQYFSSLQTSPRFSYMGKHCVLQCTWFRLTYFSNNKLYQWGMWGCFLWALAAPLKNLTGWTVGDYRVNHEWSFLIHVCDWSRLVTRTIACL